MGIFLCAASVSICLVSHTESFSRTFELRTQFVFRHYYEICIRGPSLLTLFSLIKSVCVTYGPYWHRIKCVQKIGLRVRSVSNRMESTLCICVCVCCDLDLRLYILSAIFIVLSPTHTHTYTHLTGPSKLIDSILNHITSITNCFIVLPHLSTHWVACVCVCVSSPLMVSAWSELKPGWRRVLVLELKDWAVGHRSQ